MKTTKKRLLSLLLAAVMALTLLPVMAFAEEPVSAEPTAPVSSTAPEGEDPAAEGSTEPAPATCIKTEGCTLAEGHEGECVLPATPEEEPAAGESSAPTSAACTKNEGCTLPEGHEGECMLPVVPEGAQPAVGNGLAPAAPIANVDADGYTLWDGTGAFPTNGKVRLTNDIDIDSDVVSPNGSLTIDLNGFTIHNSMENVIYFTITQNNSLTIEDTSERKSGKYLTLVYDYPAFNVNGGTFTLKGGTIYGDQTIDQTLPLLVQNGGTAIIESGSIIGPSNLKTRYGKYLVRVSGEGSKLVMSGGTLREDRSLRYSGYQLLCVENDASAEITGGNFELDSRTTQSIVAAWTAKEVKISGGTFDNHDTKNLIVGDEEITTVTGGIFNQPVTDYVADDKAEVSVNKGGDTVYAVGSSIAGAVSGAGEGDTVTVLKGDSVTDIPEGVTVKNETGSDITVNGTTVPDGGKVEAHTHNITHVEAKAPTCIEDGNIEYWYCADCGKYFKDAALTQATDAEGVKVGATGHTLTKVEEKPATHTEDGHKAYWTCSGCDKLFADENGTVIITAPAVIPSPGHSFGTEWKSDADSHWYECACGEKDKVEAHTFIWVVDKEATETEKGSKHEECTICGYEKAAVEIPMLEHTHQFGTEWKSDADNHWHECACGEKADAVAHTFGDWTTTKAATATEAGSREKSCTTCGYKVTESIPATDTGTGGGTTTTPTDSPKPTPETNAGSNTPQTGDPFSVWPFVGLLFISAAGLATLMVAHAKRRKDAE